jgi:hypothetical protein
VFGVASTVVAGSQPPLGRTDADDRPLSRRASPREQDDVAFHPTIAVAFEAGVRCSSARPWPSPWKPRARGVRFAAFDTQGGDEDMSSMQSMQSYASRTGWIMLAAIVMFSVGVFRILSGISYLANSHKINDYTAGFFGDNMWAWGLWDLLIAAIAIWAAFSLLNGGEFGRVVAYIWAILVIVNSFLIIGIAPWFAAAMITLAVLVVYGLASTPLTRGEVAADRGGGV